MNVLLEGAFYGPYASEGRWAWNIAKLLDSLVFDKSISSLDLYIPPGTDFSRDYNPKDHFPNSSFKQRRKQYDVVFSMQPGIENNQIVPIAKYKVKKKHIIGVFELYWYGDGLDQLENTIPNTTLVFAIKPYSSKIENKNWPKQFPYKILPFHSYKIRGQNNFNNKGIFLTIKWPLHSDYTEETAIARIEFFRVALKFLKQGVPVTIGYYLNREGFLNPKRPSLSKEVNSLLDQLINYGAKTLGKCLPTVLDPVLKQHSIVYTGKVNEVALYGCFYNSLCLGSIPIIYSDWPEQFFKNEYIFNIRDLESETECLLNNKQDFDNRLFDLRSNINLYSEETVKNMILDLIYE